jgi:uncharacterized protein YycO
MEYFERPKIHVLRGDRAVEALNKYVEELEENKPEELTEAQTKAMIKFAKGIISAIQDETNVLESVKQLYLLDKLKKAVKTVSQVLQEPAEPIIRDPPTSSLLSLCSTNNHHNKAL